MVLCLTIYSSGGHIERGPHNDKTSQIWFRLAKSQQKIANSTNHKLKQYLKLQTTRDSFVQFEQISMFQNGGHLGWSLSQLCTIMKEDHPRPIPDQFGLDWLVGFRGKDVPINKFEKVSLIADVVKTSVKFHKTCNICVTPLINGRQVIHIILYESGELKMCMKTDKKMSGKVYN